MAEIDNLFKCNPPCPEFADWLNIIDARDVGGSAVVTFMLGLMTGASFGYLIAAIFFSGAAGER